MTFVHEDAKPKIYLLKSLWCTLPQVTNAIVNLAKYRFDQATWNQAMIFSLLKNIVYHARAASAEQTSYSKSNSSNHHGKRLVFVADCKDTRKFCKGSTKKDEGCQERFNQNTTLRLIVYTSSQKVVSSQVLVKLVNVLGLILEF